MILNTFPKHSLAAFIAVVATLVSHQCPYVSAQSFTNCVESASNDVVCLWSGSSPIVLTTDGGTITLGGDSYIFSYCDTTVFSPSSCICVLWVNPADPSNFNIDETCTSCYFTSVTAFSFGINYDCRNVLDGNCAAFDSTVGCISDEVPTDPPQFPTDPPQFPTDPPQFPTDPPQFPTDPPQFPTDPPQFPTDPPQFPTDPPQFPTKAPQFPTRAPQLPTIAPQLVTTAAPQLVTTTAPVVPPTAVAAPVVVPITTALPTSKPVSNTIVAPTEPPSRVPVRAVRPPGGTKATLVPTIVISNGSTESTSGGGIDIVGKVRNSILIGFVIMMTGMTMAFSG